MSSDKHGLFREIEPPAGGAERFGRRLDELDGRGSTPGRRFAPAVVAAAALVAALGIVIEVAFRGDEEHRPEQPVVVYDAPQFDRLLGRPLGSAEPAVKLDGLDATLAELESGNEKIQIYRVEPDRVGTNATAP